jgi:hypothetical protein
MKYIITNNTISVVLENGTTMVCDNTHEQFEAIKTAIANKDEEEVAYLFNKIIVDQAAQLLRKTCGEQKTWR